MCQDNRMPEYFGATFLPFNTVWTGTMFRALYNFAWRHLEIGPVLQVRSIRAYGSAGINLSYLAMGAVDAYFEFGFHIWDYAAPLLIVREAGGVAMDTAGGEVDYLARRMIATASKELADQILPNITSIVMERD